MQEDKGISSGQIERTRLGNALKRDLVDEGIAMWRTTRPDIDSSAKAIVGRIIRLRELIQETVNESLQTLHIKYPTYSVLATLRVRGEPFELSPKKLKRTLLMTSGGLSNLLERIERHGWIERQSDPHDRRGVIVRLTAAGQALVDEAMVVHARTEHRIIASLSPEERELVAGLLRKILLDLSRGR